MDAVAEVLVDVLIVDYSVQKLHNSPHVIQWFRLQGFLYSGESMEHDVLHQREEYILLFLVLITIKSLVWYAFLNVTHTGLRACNKPCKTVRKAVRQEGT